MKPTAFRALTANRVARNKVYGIFGFKKNGTRMGRPIAPEPTEEFANRAADRIRGLNPGKRPGGGSAKPSGPRASARQEHSPATFRGSRSKV